MPTLTSTLLLLVVAPSCGAVAELEPRRPLERREVVLHLADRDQSLSLLSGGPADRPAVLLLHGARYDSADWQGLGTLDLLVERGFRVAAVDLPGFGGSPAGALDDPVAFLLTLIEDLDLRRPVLVSPSMSGRFALPLVSAAPDRLTGWVALAPVAIEEHLEELDGNALPTLLLWGEDDTVVPPARARALAERLEHARLVVIQDAGHPAYLERPEAFHGALLDFLAELFPDTARER